MESEARKNIRRKYRKALAHAMEKAKRAGVSLPSAHDLETRVWTVGDPYKEENKACIK